ncbi:hypothetical protein SFRURICE_004027, partial [Spodoptera frugiperda]
KDGSISDTDYLTTWQGMEDVQMINLTRSIGVSNFNITQMQRLWDNSRIKPAVLQIEVNPTITQNELVDWCRRHGVVVMAYSPFGAVLGRKKNGPRADHPLLQGLAQKYGKTWKQTQLSCFLYGKMRAMDAYYGSVLWMASLLSIHRILELHVVLAQLHSLISLETLDRDIVAIPRSTNKQRIRQNIDILDFSLTPEEVQELSNFNVNYRLRTPAKWYDHPYFPFEKKNLTTAEIEYIIEHSKED